jgi:hypothetical protein
MVLTASYFSALDFIVVYNRQSNYHCSFFGLAINIRNRRYSCFGLAMQEEHFARR